VTASALSRLLLVAPAFFPDGYGGAERQAAILAEAIGRLGVDVTLVAPTTWADAPEVEPTEFGRIERFKVRNYPNAGGRHMLSFLAWTRWFRRRYGHGEYRGVPIYVFHARLHALGPALAAIKSDAPLMIKLGGGGESSDFAALRAKRFLYGHWIQSLLLKRVDCFVANASQIIADLKALDVPDRRIAAFSNGVVLPPEAGLIEAFGRRNGDRFVYAGRLHPDKRLAVLYEAVVSLVAEPHPPHLVVLGEGPERARLAELAASQQHSNMISFQGFVADVYPELLKADFFVSASKREGQSNALLEAMAAGVIPVVCDASGVAEVVDHGRTGFIVKESEPAAFAEAMRVAMDMSPANRRAMALAARRFAADNIGIDAIARRTLQTLQRVIEMKRQLAE
jgi:glycosyltransferase involved in cell wall biosynthesis